ncbi:MAG TPA: hypothetical protein VIJ94_04860 [Caulobacteraceae bacterium]
MTPLSLRFAARELRSGVRGFRIFLACLALGVAAIAAAGSTAEAFRRGLASEAREILGGDLVVSADRVFTGKERAVFEAVGARAYSSASRAMAEAPSGQRRMVELRAVDPAYPLAGSVELTGPDGRATPLSDALHPLAGVPAAAVEQTLLDRLQLRLGQTFTVADHRFLAAAVLVSEPDRLTRGFALGPGCWCGWPTSAPPALPRLPASPARRCACACRPAWPRRGRRRGSGGRWRAQASRSATGPMPPMASTG